MQMQQATLPPRERQSLPVPLPVSPRPRASGAAIGRPAAPDQMPRRCGKPFRDAESCIVWTIRCLAEEAETGRRPQDAAICAPAEVVKCLDTLYRRRRIDLHHVRVLRLWAHRGRAPDRAQPMERADWRIWREALDRLDWPLRSLGIIS